MQVLVDQLTDRHCRYDIVDYDCTKTHTTGPICYYLHVQLGVLLLLFTVAVHTLVVKA